MLSPPAEFSSYFHRRARRFASLYRSEAVTRLLGRGALFDRVNITVELVVAAGAGRILDVGCGSGPLFAPLAQRGVAVHGIDPAPAMVELARQEAALYPRLVSVESGGWENLDGDGSFDVAVALGVFDYVEKPVEVLRAMGRAAPVVIGSFPSPGVRLALRRFRYGLRGVRVHGYPRAGLDVLARQSGFEVVVARRLGRAGHLVQFRRAG